MDPADQAARSVPRPLAPGSQTTCYLPWLKVSVSLRYVLSFPWTPDAWREVRQHIPWLLAEQDRIRKAGWFNCADDPSDGPTRACVQAGCEPLALGAATIVNGRGVNETRRGDKQAVP